MQLEDYKALRLGTLGTSLVCSLLSLGIILYRKLHGFVAYRLVLFMVVSQALVMLMALLNVNPTTNGVFCQMQAFFIHYFWVLSFLLNTLILLIFYSMIVKGSTALAERHVGMTVACLVFCAVVMSLPFTYDGYGPHYSTIIIQKKPVSQSFFCGWKNHDSFDWTYFLNYTLVNFVIISVNIWLRVKLWRTNNYTTSKQEEMFVRVLRIQTLTYVLEILNMIVRLFDSVIGEALVEIFFWVGFTLDLAPVLTLFFIIFAVCFKPEQKEHSSSLIQ